VKRYYLCPIIGAGTDLDPYRLAIQDYPDTPFEMGEIPVDPETGIPTVKWGLVLVGGKYHGKFVKDAHMKPLPDYPLDGKVSGIHTLTKNKMLSDMESLGIDTAFVGNADGYREVIRGLGRQINPGFDENDFDVNES